MTAVLPRTSGRHRTPDTTDEPRWATAAEFREAWSRVGRHAAPESPDRSADDDAFDWLATAPAAS